jgi:sulfotransferase
MKNYFFLSGLPRAGSTLLSAILDQNPQIHAEGNSAVCQMLWDNHVSINEYAAEQIQANRKQDVANEIIKAIPDLYYKNATKPYILDKCRSWTLESNTKLIKKYITNKPKIIVLIRPIDEIVKSFVNLYTENKKFNPSMAYSLLQDGSEPIMRSYFGIVNAVNENDNEMFLFLSYKDLISDTQNSLKKIYSFFELDFFEHNLSNIVQQHQEDDSVYGLDGQHDIRNSITERKIDIDLPDNLQSVCKNLNKQIGL